MQLQTTVTQLGNSDAIIIPAPIMRDVGLKRGQKVYIDRLGDSENLVIITKPKKSSARASQKEFQKWYDVFIKENGEILDELATR